MNLLKDVSCGDNPPKEINVIVEIPKGSSNKYEYDEKENCFALDRTLYSSLFFPFSYGFVPQTLSEDDDPLDVIVLTTFSVFPGCKIKVRPIGILLMEDEAGVDHKIVAVPSAKIDPRFKEIEDVKDIPEHLRKEIQEFFEIYKRLEPGKFVKVTGWEGKEKAEEAVEAAIKRYKEKEN